VAGTVAISSSHRNDVDSLPTLVIVDDNVEFLASAEAMLREEGFDVIGCVSDASRAVEEIRLLQPAVVLVDVYMPDLDGFETAQLIRQRDRSHWQ
jgi:CheY-like chemotaxis protein